MILEIGTIEFTTIQTISGKFELTGKDLGSSAIDTGQKSKPADVSVINSNNEIITHLLPPAELTQPGGAGTNWYITINAPETNVTINFWT